MVVVAMNELSFAGSSSTTDVDLLRGLGRTLRAAKSRVSERHRRDVSFRPPEVLGPAPKLPGSTRVSTAIRQVTDEVERNLLLMLFDYPGIPCPLPAQFHHNGEPAHGLGHALGETAPVVSLDVPPFQRDVLRVDSSRPTVPTGDVANLWTVQIPARWLEALRRHVDVLPAYSDPGHHDPGSGKYKNGKAIRPRGAERLLSHAVLADTGWWTRCEHGFYHRFAREDPTHWNGTTDPNARQVTRDNDVPAAVRAYWAKRPGITDCGCHRPV